MLRIGNKKLQQNLKEKYVKIRTMPVRALENQKQNFEVRKYVKSKNSMQKFNIAIALSSEIE